MLANSVSPPASSTSRAVSRVDFCSSGSDARKLRHRELRRKQPSASEVIEASRIMRSPETALALFGFCAQRRGLGAID